MKLGRVRRNSRSRTRQEGYFLLVLMFFVFLLTLAVLAMAPREIQQIKRDREEEMIHRGAQYSRAIKRYFRKFGRYPGSLEQLQNTNRVRFIRQLYKDPLTEDGKWKELHFGDVKLASAPSLGAPAGQSGGSAGSGQATPTQGPSTGFSLGPGLSQTQGQGLTLGQGLSQGQALSSGQSPTGGQTATTGSSGRGGGAQTFGAAIIGVASLSEEEGIREFNQKTHYNEWYFVYDPAIDRGGLITGPYTGKVFGGTGGVAPGTPGTGATGTGTGLGVPAGSLAQPSQPQPPMSPQPPKP